MMPATNFEKVIQFMNTYGQEDKRRAELPSEDIVAVADALTDILYVVYGAGAAFGINLDACFHEVHSSNMSKLGEDGKPIYREDGKVMKGPNFREPDLKTIVSENK